MAPLSLLLLRLKSQSSQTLAPTLKLHSMDESPNCVNFIAKICPELGPILHSYTSVLDRNSFFFTWINNNNIKN